MVAQFKQKRGTANNLAVKNPILADGELVWDKTNRILLIGDGIHPWNQLKPSFVPLTAIQAKGDLLVGGGPNAVARLPRGTVGQTLSVDAGGNLVWIDGQNASSYVPSGSAATIYETQVEAANAHDGLITSAMMSSTYETIAVSNAEHALMETFTHSAATYATRTSADATYERKTLMTVKQTTKTVTNSTVLVNDDVLLFPVLSGGIHVFEIFLSYVATVAGKMTISLGGPTGSTVAWGVHGANTIGANQQFSSSWVDAHTGTLPTSVVTLAGGESTDQLFATIKGVFHAAADGFVNLKFAQLTATADSGCSITPPSYVRAYKTN